MYGFGVRNNEVRNGDTATQGRKLETRKTSPGKRVRLHSSLFYT